MLNVWSFYHTENKHTLYHKKVCVKSYCKSSSEHAKL